MPVIGNGEYDTSSVRFSSPIPSHGLSLETLILLVSTASFLIGAVLWSAHSPLIEKTDFALTYLAATMIHTGHGAELYDIAYQNKTRLSLFKASNPLLFEHPPFEALLLAPLASLPYKTAYLIWGLFNALIWLGLPYLARPYLPTPRNELAYLAVWMLFPPLGVALYQGQSSLVVLLFVTLSFIALKQGHEFRSGLLLGLALFKFQFVVPFVLIFLVGRKWSLIKGFLTSAVALGVLSLAAVGRPGMIGYVRLLTNIAGHPHNVSYGSATDVPTLQGFVVATLGNVLNSSATAVLVLTVTVGLIIYMAWQWRRIESMSKSFDLLFAASVVVALVSAIHIFTHDLSPLILSLLLLAPHIVSSNSLRARSTLTTLCVVFWMLPVYIALIAWHRMYFLFPLLAAVGFSCIILVEESAGAAATKRCGAEAL